MSTYPSVPAPNFPIRERKYYDTIVTNIVGKELRRLRHSIPIRSWTLTYTHINEGECKYLRDFLIARKGRLEEFTFIHPGDTTESFIYVIENTNDYVINNAGAYIIIDSGSASYTVRFIDDMLEWKEVGNNLFDVSVELIEVL